MKTLGQSVALEQGLSNITDCLSLLEDVSGSEDEQ